MELNEYQAHAARTLKGNKGRNRRKQVAAMNLAGEAGEVVDLVKKEQYHGTPIDRAKLVKELGDCLWAVAATGFAYGITLQEVAEVNVEKLQKRYPNGFTKADAQARRDEHET